MKGMMKSAYCHQCEDCTFWEHDRGIFTATGWTGAGRKGGWCQYEPRTVRKNGDSTCHHWRSSKEKP